MKRSEINQDYMKRLAALTLLMFAGFCMLAAALWRMQLGQASRYEASLELQSVRRVRIPGFRGRIFDRRGVCLAENEPSYCIVIYLEEARRLGRRGRAAEEALKLVGQVAGVIGKEPELDAGQISRHLFSRRLLPIVAWRNIDAQTMARLAESGPNLPALDVLALPSRRYPLGATACHVLGYVGSRPGGGHEDDESDQEDHHYYVPDMEGRRGIEKKYDAELAGSAGGVIVRVDVSGFKYGEIGRREPAFGNDLMLALDVDIQRIAEDAIADTVGAVVVLDPRNGDVLAMASAPGFDLGNFTPSLSPEIWKGLMADEQAPLLNRAATGLYPPGSVFKPIVAMGVLEKAGAAPQMEYLCEGSLLLGDNTFSCYRGKAHGLLGFVEALEFSCNVFFYRLGLDYGYDCIYEAASELGLGSKTGIDLDYEAAGLLPSREWKYRRTGEPWRAGDTCNVAIGQGALMVTPLQMAVVAAAIANGGRVYEPRLVIGRRAGGESEFQMNEPRLRRAIGWSAKNLDIIKKGMRAVIQEQRGTGHAAQVPGVVMGGKTGTAEYGRRDARRNHGWMMVFAPFDEPRYAVAMVMDEAVSGGSSVGPRIGAMMREIFTLRGMEGS